jgi:energy-converting hydrogenase Eha subunit F
MFIFSNYSGMHPKTPYMGCMLKKAQHLPSVVALYLALLLKFRDHMPHMLVFNQTG